ncbi:hypothetical protein AB7M47_001018 [Bradyrhizobium elkanii]
MRDKVALVSRAARIDVDHRVPAAATPSAL